MLRRCLVHGIHFAHLHAEVSAGRFSSTCRIGGGSETGALLSIEKYRGEVRAIQLEGL